MYLFTVKQAARLFIHDSRAGHRTVGAGSKPAPLLNLTPFFCIYPNYHLITVFFLVLPFMYVYPLPHDCIILFFLCFLLCFS
jgi:hypothetical protein